MDIKVKRAEKTDKVLVFLQSKEQQLKDLKSIVRWAKEHKVALGEIVEMLTAYDHYKEESAKKGISLISFGDFEQFIHDMIINNITEGDK